MVLHDQHVHSAFSEDSSEELINYYLIILFSTTGK